MESTDEAVNATQTKLAAAYGVGAGALPWQAILAAIMSMLSGCVPAPPPGMVKAQLARPVVALRMFRRLHAVGVPVQAIPHVIDAAKTVLGAAADDEVNTFLAAAQESA